MMQHDTPTDSESKSANPELRALPGFDREQFDHLVAEVRDYAIFLLDAGGHVATWNRGAELLKGFRAKEILGSHFSRFYPQEVVAAGWPEEELRIASEVGRFEDEGWRVRKDGTQFWANVVITALYGEAGQVRGFLKITRDLTERKLAEESLHSGEERFRLMVESVKDYAIFMLDPEGRVVTWNSGAARINGYHADEIIGRHFSIFYPPERIAEGWPEHELAEARGTGRFEDEGWRLRNDGSRLWASVVITALYNEQGELRGFAKVTRDLTERKQTEEALRRAKDELEIRVEERTAELRNANEVLQAEIAQRQRVAERLRLLWESAAVLLTTDDSDAMLRGLFAKIGPPLGLDSYFNYVVGDDSPSLRLASYAGIADESLDEIRRLEFGQAVCGAAFVRREPVVINFVQQSDDPRLTLIKPFGFRAYACYPLVADDRLLGTLSFATRSRDEFSRDDQEFLQTICSYVTVAYERPRLIHQLREADRRKDEFLATLAHELRNPLAPLSNSLQIMRLAERDLEALTKSRNVMERQLAHLVRLVDDLLDVSRISRGKIELRKERLDLAGVVNSAMEICGPLIERARHQLTVELPKQPIYVQADRTRLAQVLSNLLTNAAKYTDKGGRIWLSASVEQGEAVVRVKDTGMGIPADMLPRVFEMFTQVDRSLEKAQGGLGVGLSIVRRLVEMHGGKIEARSEGIGRRSEFIVRLPAATVPAEEQPPKAIARPAAIGKGHKILVVDDNADSALSLAMVLKIMGNETRTALNGLEAMEVAAEFLPDVLLLDIGMPKLNGYEVARLIREQPWGHQATLIALTGWGQEEDRRRSKEAGFDHHLVKPVEMPVLEKLLAGLKSQAGGEK